MIDYGFRRPCLYHYEDLDMDRAITAVVFTGTLDILSLVISCGLPNIQIPTESGITHNSILKMATDEHNLPAMRFLLSVDVDPEDIFDSIVFCVDYRAPETLCILLEYIDTTSERLQTIIGYAARTSEPGILECFIKAGCDPSPMLLTSVSNYPDTDPCVIQYLLDAGADVNYSNDEALITAVCHDDLRIISVLINAGADVNARNGYPVHISKVHKNYTCLELLIDAGARTTGVYVEPDSYDYELYNKKNNHRRRNKK